MMDVREFIAELDRMFTGGRAAEVDAYLRSSLARADGEGDGAAALTILNEMIGYYRSISAHDDAVAASERALAETAAPGLRDSPARGTTLLNAATAYRAAGLPDRALPLYLEALAVYSKTLPPDDGRLAGLHNNIASLHEAAGDHEKALDALRKSAGVLAGKEGGVESATVDTNIALVLLKLGRDDEARETLDRALAVFERMRGREGARPSHYASALAALAQMHFVARRYDDAAATYEKALEELRFHYGENQDYAATCRNYAVVLDALGREREAAETRCAAERAENALKSRK